MNLLQFTATNNKINGAVEEFCKFDYAFYCRNTLTFNPIIVTGFWYSAYSKDLLAEILPLLEECIIADFEVTDENILMKMLNGQNFKISIEEV